MYVTTIIILRINQKIEHPHHYQFMQLFVRNVLYCITISYFCLHKLHNIMVHECGKSIYKLLKTIIIQKLSSQALLDRMSEDNDSNINDEMETILSYN